MSGASATTRVMTLRLPAGTADEVEFAARVDDTTASEFIREAIVAQLASRRADPAFQARLRERVEADRRILDRLTEGLTG